MFINFFGEFKKGADVFLIMEYISLGNLEQNVIALSRKLPELES